MRTLATLLVPCVSALPAAAQCEIALPDPAPSITAWLSDVSFAPGLVAAVGDYNKVALFEPTPAGWLQTVSLACPGLMLFESPRVCTDGDRVVVGMIEDGPTLNAQGRAYLFERSKNWQQPTLFEAPLAQGFETFGSAMDIQDDTLVIGASMTVQDVLCGPGELHVFEFDGSAWQHAGVFAPHGQFQSMGGFGLQLDLDGDTLVAGAGWDDELLQFSGAVYVYERGANGWQETHKLFSPAAVRDGMFGEWVALDGDTLAVGEPGAERVHVFRRGVGTWERVQVLQARGGTPGDGFGASLDLEGDLLVVGAPRFDQPSLRDAGALYAFRREGGVWAQFAQLDAAGLPTVAQTGTRVFLAGNQVLWAGKSQPSTLRLHSLGIESAANLCATTPNSSGASAEIGAEGCDSVLAGSLTLTLVGAPANEIGLFAFSDSGVQTPFGNGFLCLGAPFERLSGGRIDGNGHLQLDVDFTSASGALLAAGGTWHFQAFFRDVGFGAGFGSSDAIALALQP